MPRTLPAGIPLVAIKDSSHHDDSSSEYDSDESLEIPKAPPMIPPPGGDEDLAILHGSLLPHLDRITTTTAVLAGERLRYLTIPGLVFKNFGFDDMTSDCHFQVLAQLLLFTEYGEPSLEAAKGYIAGVSANRRSSHLRPSKVVYIDGKKYEIQDAFDVRTGLIQFRKKLLCSDKSNQPDTTMDDGGREWTDVVRYHVEDTAKFCRMIYPAETVKDSFENEEEPWTKWQLWDQQDGVEEGGCWSHSKRGVPYMGPYDNGK
jgi:hypothetical protein